MKRWIVIGIPLLVLASLIVWRLDQKRAEVSAMAEMRTMRMKAPSVVSLTAAQTGDVALTHEATGTVESPQNVKIAPKIAGRIDFLEVHEGDRVKKGQVLVRIDPTEVEAQALQKKAELAEAQYRLAQAQLNQAPTDVAVNTQIRQQKAGVASTSADFNQARESSKAQLAAAEANVTEAQGKVESAEAIVANTKALLGSAQANLENARTKHNRVMELYKQGYIAAQDVDDAKASLKVHEAALETAQGQVKSATALYNASLAQKHAAEQQAKIAKAKGTADVEAARAKMLQSEASLDYANANSVQGPAYKQSLAALRSSVAAAQAALRAAEARRQDTVLVSPLDGFVTGRYADPGAMASSGQPILSVQFIKQIWVSIGVPERVCAKLHIGQPAQVTFDAIPEKTFQANVIQINPSADLESRQFTVRLILSNSQNLFKPGMFAHVGLETDRLKGATVVPREAVQRDKNGPYVVVVDKSSKARRQPVITGMVDTKMTAIEQGIRPGERVVTLSAGPVKDGQIVRVGGGKGKRERR